MNTSLEDLLAAAMQAGMHMGAGQHPAINAQNEAQRRLLKTAADRAWSAYQQQAPHQKAGARHSAADLAEMQAMHDLTVRQGATCAATKAWTPPSSIKAVGGGKVEGLLCRYSDPRSTDLEHDYFNHYTDFGVQDDATLPLLWHHNQDPNKRGAIGKGVVKFTDAGLWFQSWLNQRDEYERFILKMIELGKAGYSGGASAIARLASVGKSRLITKFHLVEGSITPTPMDPANAVSLKAMIGIDPRLKRIKQDLAWLERERVLSIEADLDQLERAMRIEAELKALGV